MQARLIHYEFPLGTRAPPNPIALFKTGLNLAQKKEMSLLLIVISSSCGIFPIFLEEEQCFQHRISSHAQPHTNGITFPLPSYQMKLVLHLSLKLPSSQKGIVHFSDGILGEKVKLFYFFG